MPDNQYFRIPAASSFHTQDHEEPAPNKCRVTSFPVGMNLVFGISKELANAPLLCSQ
jgi:hypothetical protein